MIASLCSLAPAGISIHCLIGDQISGLLGQEDVFPHFAITVAQFVLSNLATLGKRQIRRSPGLALNTHSGPNSSADWDPGLDDDIFVLF